MEIRGKKRKKGDRRNARTNAMNYEGNSDECDRKTKEPLCAEPAV